LEPCAFSPSRCIPINTLWPSRLSALSANKSLRLVVVRTPNLSHGPTSHTLWQKPVAFTMPHWASLQSPAFDLFLPFDSHQILYHIAFQLSNPCTVSAETQITFPLLQHVFQNVNDNIFL
jgi:hypothetical protein